MKSLDMNERGRCWICQKRESLEHSSWSQGVRFWVKWPFLTHCVEGAYAQFPTFKTQKSSLFLFKKFVSFYSSWFTMFQFLLYSKVTQTYKYIHYFSHILFHHVLSQEIGQSSLCYTIGSQCLSILNVIVNSDVLLNLINSERYWFVMPQFFKKFYWNIADFTKLC